MRVVLLRFVLLVAASWAGVLAKASYAQQPDPNAKLAELSAQAQAAQQRGDYASAADAYRQLVQLHPEMGEIWANLGLMHQFLGDYTRAEREFQTALRKNSRLFVPNLFIGLNRLRAHEPQAALPYLKVAASLNRDDEQVALGLGRAYTAIQDTESAVRWLERATEINPRDPDAWYELGVNYLTLQDDAVNRLKKYNPDAVYARTLVADAFLEQGRTKDAILIYERFRSEHDPPCLKSKLGFAYAHDGSTEKAKQAFEDEISGGSGCLLAHLGLARLAFTEGDTAEALSQLRHVNDRDPNFFKSYLPEIWNQLDPEHAKSIAAELQRPEWSQDLLARELAEVITSGNPPADIVTNRRTRSSIGETRPAKLGLDGRYGECVEQARKVKPPRPAELTHLLEQCSFYSADYRLALQISRFVLRSNPRDPAALFWQAKSTQQLAASSFSQMNALAPDSPKIHLLMAELHSAREDFPRAEEEYANVLGGSGSKEEKTSAHLGLARAYFRTLENDKALDQLQFVLGSDPSNATAQFLMGEVLVGRHEYEEAMPHLKVAIQGLPSDSLPEAHALLAKCYAGRREYAQALEELKPALNADTMGTFHYQLYQLYQKLGDEKSAAAALQQSQQLRQRKACAEQQQTRSKEN